jgi:glucose-6-phosphate isomerase
MRQPSLTSTAAFQALETHAIDAEDWQMRSLFAADPQRFERMSVEAAGLFLDYSKNRLDGRTLELLADLARERGVEERREAMFNGERINLTEHRAVLHTALRAPRDASLVVDGQDVTADVHAVLARMKRFSDAVRNGTWLGHSGKPITDVVNIGIGGSDLGPKMVCLALRQYSHPRLSLHFVWAGSIPKPRSSSLPQKPSPPAKR